VFFLLTVVVYLPADGHPSSTNRTWHRVTSLTESNTLPLSQANHTWPVELSSGLLEGHRRKENELCTAAIGLYWTQDALVQCLVE